MCSGLGTDLSVPMVSGLPITLYESLSSCSNAVNDAIDDAIAAVMQQNLN